MQTARWLSAACLAATVTAPALALPLFDVKQVGSYKHVGAAEISAFDAKSKQLFVVNGGSSAVDVLDVSNPASPTFVKTLIPDGKANSVAIKNGIVAVASANSASAQNPGKVQFFDTAGNLLKTVDVGAVPDMVTFTPDGTKVLVANEGEPNSYNQANSVDPEGSVSIIDISGGVASASVSTAGFTAFNGQLNTLKAAGVRIFGPNATVAQDLEPEYIAVSPDGATAYVTLQENNAIAVLDIATATITDIKPLGLKNHNLPGNALDASDRDVPGASNNGIINIQNWPVLGMYQPDAIATYQVNGQVYTVIANEGDARDYTGFAEEARVNSLDLDNTVFPNETVLKNNDNLGRLTVTRANGDIDGDLDYDQLHVFGARSFSILDANGNFVFDSGDQLERITADLVPSLFNSNGDAGTFDTRSDNKGPEPEGLAVGTLWGRTVAFVGLERTGGVAAFDITNPASPTFLTYFNHTGDLAPEGLLFIDGKNTPDRRPWLVVANEVSNTTTIYQFSAPVPEPMTAGLSVLGLAGLTMVATRRRR